MRWRPDFLQVESKVESAEFEMDPDCNNGNDSFDRWSSCDVSFDRWSSFDRSQSSITPLARAVERPEMSVNILFFIYLSTFIQHIYTHVKFCYMLYICDLANEKGPQGGFWKAWKMSLYNTLWIWPSAGEIYMCTNCEIWKWSPKIFLKNKN